MNAIKDKFGDYYDFDYIFHFVIRGDVLNKDLQWIEEMSLKKEEYKIKLFGYKWDRIHRTKCPMEGGAYFERLYENGVEFYFVRHESDIHTIRIKYILAENRLRNNRLIGLKTSEEKKIASRCGGIVQRAIGIINAVEVVVKIYKMKKRNASIHDTYIAKMLNKKGFRTRDKEFYDKRSVQHVRSKYSHLICNWNTLELNYDILWQAYQDRYIRIWK